MKILKKIDLYNELIIIIDKYFLHPIMIVMVLAYIVRYYSILYIINVKFQLNQNITSLEKLKQVNYSFAIYADVYTQKYHYENIISIRDVTHAMSPQLLFTISKEIKFSSQILYGKRMSWFRNKEIEY